MRTPLIDSTASQTLVYLVLLRHHTTEQTIVIAEFESTIQIIKLQAVPVRLLNILHLRLLVFADGIHENRQGAELIFTCTPVETDTVGARPKGYTYTFGEFWSGSVRSAFIVDFLLA